jgi:hypothetical protein
MKRPGPGQGWPLCTCVVLFLIFGRICNLRHYPTKVLLQVTDSLPRGRVRVLKHI